MRSMLAACVVVTSFLAAMPAPAADPCGGCAGCSLSADATTRGVLAGVAVDDRVYSDSTYANLVSGQFNYLNLEYFYWASIHPTATTWTWTAADNIFNWGQAANKAMLGHHIIWARNERLPTYWQNLNASDLTSAIQSYVTTLVGRDPYKGHMRSWSAVNEAISDIDFTLRDNFIKNKLGGTYIDLIFNTAHAADPNALLFYNEYGAEGLGNKADAVYNHAQTWLSRGVPVNGIGLQCHFDAATMPSFTNIQANIQRLTNLGLIVELSELDVQITHLSGTLTDQLDKQRYYYRSIVNACLAVPGCKAVNVFGIDDPHSWIVTYQGKTNEHPLLWDGAYHRKPAYYGVLEALRNTWFGCIDSESGIHSCM